MYIFGAIDRKPKGYILKGVLLKIVKIQKNELTKSQHLFN